MDTFFAISFYGATLNCHLDTSGPFIASQHGDVHLGVCSFNHLGPWQWRPSAPPLRSELKPQSWWIVKYDHEQRIALPGMATRVEVAALSAKVGIPIWTPLQRPREPVTFFYESPAFEALCTLGVEASN